MTWRLLIDSPANGAWNMAVDEAILTSHAAGEAPPTVRFYAWEPSCLSLGRLQRLTAEHRESISNLDVVRRPTGGRAVWHADEVTYAVAMRTELLPRDATSVNGSYTWVSQAWLSGLRRLGVRAELAQGGVRTNGANCFAANAGCDFLVDGRKLIGAAQCRADDTILQHGSLLRSVDAEEWRRAAGGPMTRAISLRELGVEPSWSEVVEALVIGFSLAHGVQLLPGQLSTAELDLANRLHLYKYSSPLWTFDAKVDLSLEQVSYT